MENIRWTFDGLFPAGFLPALTPAVDLPAAVLRATGELVLATDFPAGRPLARCGVPDDPALLAVLGGILVEKRESCGEWHADWIRRGVFNKAINQYSVLQLSSLQTTGTRRDCPCRRGLQLMDVEAGKCNYLTDSRGRIDRIKDKKRKSRQY